MTDEIRQAIKDMIPSRQQSELARQAGISIQHFNDLLQGRRGSLSDAWVRLLKTIGLELTVKKTGMIAEESFAPTYRATFFPSDESLPITYWQENSLEQAWNGVRILPTGIKGELVMMRYNTTTKRYVPIDDERRQVN